MLESFGLLVLKHVAFRLLGYGPVPLILHSIVAGTPQLRKASGGVRCSDFSQKSSS